MGFGAADTHYSVDFPPPKGLDHRQSCVAIRTAECASQQSQASNLGLVASHGQIPKGLEMRLPCEDVLDELVTMSVSLHHNRELNKQPAKASDSHSQSI